MLTQALQTGPDAQHEPDLGPDLTDEVGALLKVRPGQLSVPKAIELLVAGREAEQIQMLTILHARMGNAFLRQVLAAMTPTQLRALDHTTPVTPATTPGVDGGAAVDPMNVGSVDPTTNAVVQAPLVETTPSEPPNLAKAGVDASTGYVAHPELPYTDYTPTYAEDGTRTRAEDADPVFAKTRLDANAATLDGSNVQARIAALTKLRASLPKKTSSIALSAAITAELVDLTHDRNLLDGDAATKPWIGNRNDLATRKTMYPGHVPTDCTEYVDKAFREAMAAVGQASLCNEILSYAHATAKRSKAGKELYSGVDMQRALTAKLGWQSAYVDESGDKAGLSTKGGAQSFYRAPVATTVLSSLGGEDMQALRETLAEIPFAVVTVNSGGHMKMLARGIVYECHWSDTGTNLFEATPLEQVSWSHTLMTAPAEDIAKLKALKPKTPAP